MINHDRRTLVSKLEETGFVVYYEEIKDKSPNNYILITQLEDNGIKADDTNQIVKSTFQFQFRTKDVFNKNAVKEFMYNNFNCKSTHTYDNEIGYYLVTYYDIELLFKGVL